jgi:hypothetical protein
VTDDAAAFPYQLDPFAEAVGQVAAADAMLEDTLSGLYAGLLQSPLAELVARGQSFDTLSAAIKTLLVELAELPQSEQLLRLLERARSLHQQRNVVVHSMWFGAAGMPERADSLRPRRWQREAELRSWDVAQIRLLADGLRDLVSEIWEVGESAVVELSPEAGSHT